MELLIGLIVLVVLGYLLFVNNSKKPLDVNKDGKVDSQDAIAVAPVLTQTIVEAADVNKDGKVDVADAVEVVKKTTKRVKDTAAKVKPKKVVAKAAKKPAPAKKSAPAKKPAKPKK
jgi:hypothetical protein